MIIPGIKFSTYKIVGTRSIRHIYIYVYYLILKWKHSCGLACQIGSILRNVPMTAGRHAREQVCTAIGRKQFERPNQPCQVRSSGNNPIKLFSGGAPWRESSGSVMIRGTLRFWWKRPEMTWRNLQGGSGVKAWLWRTATHAIRSLGACIAAGQGEANRWSGNLTWHRSPFCPNLHF